MTLQLSKVDDEHRVHTTAGACVSRSSTIHSVVSPRRARIAPSRLELAGPRRRSRRSDRRQDGR